jgi:hypothetical protein
MRTTCFWVVYIVVNIWQWCWWELTLIKPRFSSRGYGNHSRLWLSCLDQFVVLFPKLWKLFISNAERKQMLDLSNYIQGARYGLCWYVMNTVYSALHYWILFLCSFHHQVKEQQRCWWELTLIKPRFSSRGYGNLSRLWLSCLDQFVVLFPKIWKLFGFAIFQFVCVQYSLQCTLLLHHYYNKL